MQPNSIYPHMPAEPDFSKKPSEVPIASAAGGVAMSHAMPEMMSSSQASGQLPDSKLTPNSSDDEPVGVVKVLSTRGVEYAMMTFALWISAVTAAWVLLSLVYGSYGFSYLAAPVSALVVCLPIFGLLFLRLKKGELANPSLRLDPSKRRWSQITQLLAYLACLVNIIYFVFSVMQKIGSDSEVSILKSLLSLLAVLVVAGGILAYYWFDEHRIQKG